MAVSRISTSTPLVLLGQQTGITVIPAQTPLTRLNYFDGKFLRAQDLQAEQNYLRQLTQLSNQANGFGVVNGFNVTLGGGDQLTLGPGLAIDPAGRVLLLGQEQSMSVQELIDKSRNFMRLLQSETLKSTGGFAECTMVSEAPTTNAAAGRDWYLLVLAHAEALCGEEDVYGKLCEEACVTSTDRPFRVEGVVLRALPLTLATPLPTSAAVQLDRSHLRSLIASAYFADESRRLGSLISGAGLKSEAWCFGAIGLAGNEVPVGVLVRDGNSSLFIDEWIARRELIETSPRRYWQWRMSMRPWDVFQAQINQFQCQLHSRLEGGVDTTPDDPCAEARRLVGEAATHFKVLSSFYKQTTSRLAQMSKSARDQLLEGAPELGQSGAQYAAFEARLVQASQAFQLMPQDRLLIRSGIVETPSAGYLPVVPGNTLTVNQQVRRLMGEGVDLRFCVVRPDYIPHALEEAQHMERISLLRGLDNPNARERVDVLVPNGKIAPDHTATGRFYEMRVNLIPENLELLALAAQIGLRDKNPEAASRIGASLNVDGDATSLATAIRLYAALMSATDRRAPQTLEYSGAAFADASEQGALTFYYAGITRPTSLHGTKPTPAPSPTPAPAPVPSPSPGPAPGTGTGGLRINTNVAALSFADLSKQAAISRVLRLNTNLTTNLERDIEARASMWLATEIAQDPTTLARGRTVAVKAECILDVTMEAQLSAQAQLSQPQFSQPQLNLLRDSPALVLGPDSTVNTNAVAGTAANARQAAQRVISRVVRLGFTGEFSIDDMATRPGPVEVREAKGTLSGELTVSVRSGGTTNSNDQETFSVYLSEPVRIQRSMASFGPLFQILAPDWSIFQPLVGDIEVEREWKAADKAEAIGTIHFQAPSQQDANNVASHVPINTAANLPLKDTVRQAFRAWQAINARVAEPQHPAHEDAIRALRSIGAGLGSPKFADLAAQRLFPAPKPASSDLSVLATLDWVMFHRRREKTCSQERPTLPVETRQYALYHVQLTGDHTLAELRRLLERAAANTRLPALDFVQLVEFGAGIHAVTSSHPQLQASWRQDVGAGAGRIVGGFIASQGVAAAEGPRLAQERIESLADVLAAVTPEERTPNYQVLTRVPDTLGSPSNDGVIIVVTREAVVASNDHTVIAVENTQQLETLMRAAAAGNFVSALAGDKVARNLGVVRFSGVTPVAAQMQAVESTWSALDFRPAMGATVFANNSDAAAATYRTQSTGILATLGGQGNSQAVSTTETLSTPAITIVAGGVQYRNVLYIYGVFDVERNFHRLDATSTNSPGGFRNDVLQGDALRNYILSLTANQPVFGVTQALVNGLPDASAQRRMTAVMQTLNTLRPNPAGQPTQVVEALTPLDRTSLGSVGHNASQFDEIYFFARARRD